MSKERNQFVGRSFDEYFLKLRDFGYHVSLVRSCENNTFAMIGCLTVGENKERNPLVAKSY